jgi:hypothetical protein
MNEDDNQPHSPDVAKRLAKLKELKDSYNSSDDDFEPATSPPKTKRVREIVAVKRTEKKPTRKKPAEKSYTTDKILDTRNDESEYGKSFRGMYYSIISSSYVITVL